MAAQPSILAEAGMDSSVSIFSRESIAPSPPKADLLSSPKEDTSNSMAIVPVILNRDICLVNEVPLSALPINPSFQSKEVSPSILGLTAQNPPPTARPPQKLHSYANAVRGNDEGERLSHHNITMDYSSGENIGLIPEDIIQNHSPLWEDFLIGQFPEKAPHIGKIHVIVNKIWTYSDKSMRIDAFVENDTTIKF